LLLRKPFPIILRIVPKAGTGNFCTGSLYVIGQISPVHYISLIGCRKYLHILHDFSAPPAGSCKVLRIEIAALEPLMRVTDWKEGFLEFVSNFIDESKKFTLKYNKFLVR
jgi:hypothetical protein